MKVTIITPVWGRWDIFAIYAAGIHRLQQDSGHEVSVVIGGSEGQESKQQADKYGFDYVEVDNEPFAKKRNAALKRAKTHKPDYVITLGSDDLISNSYIDMLCRGEFSGSLNCHFYDMISRKMYLWHGYRDRRIAEPIGAGKAFSSEFLDRLGWWLWPEESKRGRVDWDSWRRVVAEATHLNMVRATGGEPFMVDLKNLQSITKWTEVENTAAKLTKVDPEKMFKRHLSKEEIKLIKNYDPPDSDNSPNG